MLKNAIGADTSKCAENADFVTLKLDIDRLDIGKLETTPADLSNLGNAVDNNVAKKTLYDELVKKINAINTSRFVLKTQYNWDWR